MPSQLAFMVTLTWSLCSSKSWPSVPDLYYEWRRAGEMGTVGWFSKGEDRAVDKIRGDPLVLHTPTRHGVLQVW
jgi:hypothetical protein